MSNSNPQQGSTTEDKLRQILLVDGFYYDEPPEITAPLIAKLMKVITTETTMAHKQGEIETWQYLAAQYPALRQLAMEKEAALQKKQL